MRDTSAGWLTPFAAAMLLLYIVFDMVLFNFRLCYNLLDFWNAVRRSALCNFVEKCLILEVGTNNVINQWDDESVKTYGCNADDVLTSGSIGLSKTSRYGILQREKSTSRIFLFLCLKNHQLRQIYNWLWYINVLILLNLRLICKSKYLISVVPTTTHHSPSSQMRSRSTSRPQLKPPSHSLSQAYNHSTTIHHRYFRSYADYVRNKNAPSGE